VSARVRVDRWRGAAALVLSAGEYEAVVVPELAMLVASFRWRDREHVALPGGLRAYRAGHTAGVPLLHPWANRLGRRRYRAAGRTVDLTRLRLHTDGNGLPIHGTMTARAGWAVERAGAVGATARADARFPFGAHPDLLASFPYPHDLGVAVALGPGGLRVTTTVRPTGRTPVPVSFGWHPYWRLDSRRAGWSLARPATRQLRLDRRGIPTGERVAAPAGRAPLAGQDLDDLFALGARRTFEISDATTVLRVGFDAAYPYAQLYSPPGARFCAIEPMTAPTNALVSGAHPTVRPGDAFRASFRASIAAVRG
jgi:galactose mutarotase-like enzyme